MNFKKIKKVCSKALSLTLAAAISASAMTSLALAGEIASDNQEPVAEYETTESVDTDFEVVEEISFDDVVVSLEENDAYEEELTESAAEETESEVLVDEAEDIETEEETETENPVENTTEDDTDAETEIETEEETTEAEEETTVEDIYGMADYDFSSLSGIDFSSKRLLIETSNPSIFVENESIISSYGDVYLIQYEDEETAMKAYAYYVDKAYIVEVDAGIQICEGEAAEIVITDTVMTEEENPFNELEEAVFYGVSSYDIALIDTGANGPNVTGAVSVIGDSTSDDNGHGTRMAEYAASQNENVSILSIKAFGSDGRADISAIYAAIEYAISQDVKVINLSASAYAATGNLILREAVNDAVNAGIIFVGSAGNNGKSAAYYVPGNINNAFIVGAADENGVRLDSSNYGDTVDVNVVAGSTSEAAAKMSGWLSAHDMAELAEIMNDGFVYETGYVPGENDEEDPEEENDAFNVNATWPKHDSNDVAGITLNWDIAWSGMDAWWESPNGAITFDKNWSCLGEKSKISDLKTGDVILWWDDTNWAWVNHIAIVTEVAADGSYFVTADGNMDTATGVGLVTRTSLTKRGASYGAVLVWRNSVHGAAIGASAKDFTQTMLVNNDTSMASQWSNINWCYCFVVAAVLETREEFGALKVTKTVSQPSGTLTISKTTEGSEEDKNTEFTFTLKVTNLSGTVVTTKFNYTKSDGSTGTISGSSGTIKLKNGQNVEITGIPQGYGYTVTETANSAFKTTVSKNGGTASNSNTVSGNIPAAPANQAFSFTVNFKDNGKNVAGLTVASGMTTNSNGNVYFTLTPGTSGSASKSFSNIPAGYTYTVTETEVKGFTTKSSGTTGTIVANDTKSASFTNTYTPGKQTVAFTNTKQTTDLTIVKTSSATGTCKSELAGNKMYSQDFSGAVFSVRVYDAASKSWGNAQSYTTGADGKITVNGLIIGSKVQVTETKAPKGYLIPSDATQEITLVEGVNEVTFKDDPTFDPGTPVINKVKYINGKLVKGEYVESAVFKMEYFDNDACSGNALRTWYFKTDSTGTFNYSGKYLANGYTSSELYVNTFGDPDLPLGSVKITEVACPKGYKLYAGSLEGKIVQNANSGLAEFSWITKSNGQVLVESDGTATVGDPEIVIAINKIDADTGKSISGAKLQILDGKNVIAEWVTDGKVKEFKGLLEPDKTYTLLEASAPENYQKAENIQFKVDAEGNITVLTENTETFTTSDGYLGIKMKDVKCVVLPVTGSRDGMLVAIIGASLVAAGVATAIVLSHRKRKEMEEE